MPPDLLKPTMALILNIDTSGTQASVLLAEDGHSIATAINQAQKDHAAWVHLAIDQVLREAGKPIKALSAIAVTAGPGSYTGIRVGFATAKGLCYALQIPLITENTLKVLAAGYYSNTGSTHPVAVLIDARRMEVFTAVYNPSLEALLDPQALILTADSYVTFLEAGLLAFIGSGAFKWKNSCIHENALFPDLQTDANALADLSYKKFMCNDFADLAYAEPAYLKEFHTHHKM